MRYIYDVDLSKRELGLLGSIIAQWGALEHEIFIQTLSSFEAELTAAQLPKQMNNMSFLKVLEMWKERVVSLSKGKKRQVLLSQHSKITKSQDYRNSLVHGMLDWNRANPEQLVSTRIRKDELRRMHFDADDLFHFLMSLAEINFKIRYPNGKNDFAKQAVKDGGSISRAGAALLSGSKIAEELAPSLFPK